MSGRPLKTTVDFFSHDCKHGKTIFILEQQYGNDGFAFWYKLLELLGDTSGHAYDCNNPDNWQYLLAYTKVSEDKAIQIINTLLSTNKIDKELWQHKTIWCQNFVNRLADVYEKRDSPLPPKPKTDLPSPISNINSITAPEMPISGNQSDANIINEPINTHSKAKHSKEEDSKYILSVFEFWNNKNIINHKILNGSESSIRIALKNYSHEELKQAIGNYAEILQDSEKYFWTYKWTLKDFLKRGVDKFIDHDVACQNYSRKSRLGENKKQSQIKVSEKNLPDQIRQVEEYLGSSQNER